MGEHYYPAGGMRDFYKTVDSVEEALAEIIAFKAKDEKTIDWYQVLDSDTMEVVEFEGLYYYNENSVVFPWFDAKDPRNKRRVKTPGTVFDWSRDW